jgi:hypothetical protein
MAVDLSQISRLADGSPASLVNEVKASGVLNSFYAGHPSVSRFHGQTMEAMSEQRQRESYAENVCNRVR